LKSAAWANVCSHYGTNISGTTVQKFFTKKEILGWALVTHTCNPSYPEAEIRRIRV
jgi:hypothetical protein